MSSKADLSRELAELIAAHLEAKPDGKTLYAAQLPPERRPWRKKPSLLDEAFREELEKAERDRTKKPPR